MKVSTVIVCRYFSNNDENFEVVAVAGPGTEFPSHTHTHTRILPYWCFLTSLGRHSQAKWNERRSGKGAKQATQSYRYTISSNGVWTGPDKRLSDLLYTKVSFMYSHTLTTWCPHPTINCRLASASTHSRVVNLLSHFLQPTTYTFIRCFYTLYSHFYNCTFLAPTIVLWR